VKIRLDWGTGLFYGLRVMNLYKITQSEKEGYDTYDSAVVCAPSPKVARSIHPSHGGYLPNLEQWKPGEYWYEYWASSPESVSVKFIGKAARGMKQGVVMASFNAG